MCALLATVFHIILRYGLPPVMPCVLIVGRAGRGKLLGNVAAIEQFPVPRSQCSVICTLGSVSRHRMYRTLASGPLNWLPAGSSGSGVSVECTFRHGGVCIYRLPSRGTRFRDIGLAPPNPGTCLGSG